MREAVPYLSKRGGEFPGPQADSWILSLSLLLIINLSYAPFSAFLGFLASLSMLAGFLLFCSLSTSSAAQPVLPHYQDPGGPRMASPASPDLMASAHASLQPDSCCGFTWLAHLKSALASFLTGLPEVWTYFAAFYFISRLNSQVTLLSFRSISNWKGGSNRIELGWGVQKNTCFWRVIWDRI